MTDRMTARGHLNRLAEDLEDAHDEIDRLTARVAELENPLGLTEEHQAARAALVERLDRAHESLISRSGYDTVERHVALILGYLAGHLRTGVPLSTGLCNRADKLAAAILDEEADRG